MSGKIRQDVRNRRLLSIESRNDWQKELNHLLSRWARRIYENLRVIPWKHLFLASLSFSLSWAQTLGNSFTVDLFSESKNSNLVLLLWQASLKTRFWSILKRHRKSKIAIIWIYSILGQFGVSCQPTSNAKNYFPIDGKDAYNGGEDE